MESFGYTKKAHREVPPCYVVYPSLLFNSVSYVSELVQYSSVLMVLIFLAIFYLYKMSNYIVKKNDLMVGLYVDEKDN